MASDGKAGFYAVHATTGSRKDDDGSRPTVDASVSKPGAAAPRILVVEDQEDVRKMLATALALEGYQVDEAANAEEGLRLLGRRRYRLVLSDYAMPGHTGTWMLAEANRLGLMKHTMAMIVTAHSDIRELAAVAVVTKPLDLDFFLDQVRSVVASSRMDSSAPRSSARPRAKQNRT